MKNNKLNKILRRFNIIYSVVLLSLFVTVALFITISNYRHKAHIAHSISNIVEEKLKNNERRDVVKILSSSQITDFKSIGYYNSDGKKIVTFPSDLNPSSSNGFGKTNLRVPLYFDRDRKIDSGTLFFSISLFEFIPQIALIWIFFVIILIPILHHHKKLIIKTIKQESSAARGNAITEIARQVRHDSRGAIQAIRAVIDSSTKLNHTEINTLKSATRRLESMINDEKISRAKDIEQAGLQRNSLCHIYTCLFEIIREKEILHKSEIEFNYEFDILRVFLPIYETDIRRIISNILDNSFDAINEKARPNGKVLIKTIIQNNKFIIEVKDNGIGIRPEQLPNIGKKGYTTKKDGAGLGISWAIQKINESGGDLKIQSQYEEWTSVIIQIPLNNKAHLAGNKLCFNGINNVVVIDDDPSFIKIWQNKISSLNRSISLTGYKSGEDYFKSSSNKKETLYLIDYDLGEDNLTGLEIISKIKSESHIYLVSNNFDDWKIQEACFRENIKLIPKTIIALLELKES